MINFDTLASNEQIEKTIAALTANGMTAEVVADKDAAKARVLELIPKGAEVMQMTSETLKTSGISAAINESGDYDAVHPKLLKMDKKTQHLEMHRLRAAPDYAIGSVNAITEDGKMLIASNTGSQLAAYVYGSEHVIFIIGAQKIVKDLGLAEQRLYKHVLPIESERLKKLYNVASNVSKLLIYSREIVPGRTTVILVKEKLGY